MTKIKTIGHALGFGLALGITSVSSYARTPAGDVELHIFPGDTQKPGESVFSISGRWLTDDELQTGFTALTFLNGPDQPKPDTAQSATKKVAKSVQRGMAYLRGSLRGLVVEAHQDAAPPNYAITNREGFSVTKITLRDYINDKYTTEIAAKSFGQKGVRLSFDVAESASIAKIEVNASIGDQNNFRANGGGIDITIGDGKTIRVETKDRSTEQIEKELASKLGGKFSSSPLFPDEREQRDKKNIKPFDGGEAQIDSMNANTYTIEVKDTSLGMINRFLFPEKSSGGGWW